MGIQDEFGHRIRSLRKRLGLTQAQLAAKCGRGMEMQSVGEIERGRRNCTLRTIERLARALGVEPAEFFLFHPQKVGKHMTVLEPRLLDAWKGADQASKAKMLRILSEMLNT